VQARVQFEQKHPHARKNWEVSTEFPSQAVTEAFLHPTVDSSGEPFEWGTPNVPEVRSLLALLARYWYKSAHADRLTAAAGDLLL
jgi:hypothetical protein